MSVIYGVVLSMVVNMGSSKIMSSLQEIIKNTPENEKIAILVHLTEKPNYEAIKGLPPKDYVEFLKTFSENSQRKILNYLNENFLDAISDLRPYWIFNGFYVKATSEVIEKLAQREDVEYIIEDFIIKIGTIPGEELEPPVRAIEWNILRVKADSCWMEGYDGSGVIIGHMDTGVDVSHPALSGKWLSPYWYDPVNGQPNPYDDNWHGTHTMGTILGGDGLGPFTEDIGVAPGAKFVTCKICNASGSCPSSAIHAGFQRIAEWKGQGVNIVAASNSWGSANTTSLEFWQDCLNLRNLGIMPVFAIGSGGPNPGTAGTPGNFPTVIGVGATDSGDNIASFSSRGPAPNQPPWNDTTYWLRPDWNFIKPDLSAPGVSIRSSVPGGNYGNASGTGHATPHVTGAIAILYEKNPYLDIYEIYRLLTDYAYHPPQGEPYPNNDYGWGRLDVYKALKILDSIPSVYVIKKHLIDENSDSIWDPGENAEIKITLRNIGDTVYSLEGKLISLNSYVFVLDSISYFGDLFPGDTTNNSSNPFLVYADTLTPTGTEIQFLLVLNGTNYHDTLTFYDTVAKGLYDYINHDCGNIVLTITKYGAIGFMGSYNNHIGSGCIFPSGSENRLFYGSFAIGNQYPYVIDRYYEENYLDDDDWLTIPGGEIHFFEPHTNYPEFAYAKYNDSQGEIKKGIEVIQRSWAYNDINGDDFITFEFVLKNKSDSIIKNLHGGIFLDWEIINPDSNKGGIDTLRNLAYAFYSPIYMGSAILNPPRDIKPANLSIIENNIYVGPFSGLPDSIELKFLKGMYHKDSVIIPQNISSVISAGPFDINPHDTVKIAFAIIGGFTLSELKKRVDTAYARYWGINIGEKTNFKRKKIFIPTFCEKLILDKDIPLEVYNILGQKIKIGGIYGNKKYYNLKKLSEGIYFIKAGMRNYKIIVVK